MLFINISRCVSKLNNFEIYSSVNIFLFLSNCLFIAYCRCLLPLLFVELDSYRYVTLTILPCDAKISYFNLSYDGGGALCAPQSVFIFLLKISPPDQTLRPTCKFLILGILYHEFFVKTIEKVIRLCTVLKKN